MLTKMEVAKQILEEAKVELEIIEKSIEEKENEIQIFETKSNLYYGLYTGRRVKNIEGYKLMEKSADEMTSNSKEVVEGFKRRAHDLKAEIVVLTGWVEA